MLEFCLIILHLINFKIHKLNILVNYVNLLFAFKIVIWILICFKIILLRYYNLFSQVIFLSINLFKKYEKFLFLFYNCLKFKEFSLMIHKMYYFSLLLINLLVWINNL